MKKLFKKINTINKELKSITANEKNILNATYYKVFSNEKEKVNDMKMLDDIRKEALKDKYALLESLQIEINKELHRVSQLESKINTKSYDTINAD